MCHTLGWEGDDQHRASAQEPRETPGQTHWTALAQEGDTAEPQAPLPQQGFGYREC